MHNAQQLALFELALENKQLGERTPYTVPMRFQAAKKLRIADIFSTLFAHHDIETEEKKMFGNIFEKPDIFPRNATKFR